VTSFPVPNRAGAGLCQQINVVNSTMLTCLAPASIVGKHSVVVSLNGRNSTNSLSLYRLCAAGRFARPGQRCSSCPRNAVCLAMFPVPLPLPGFFALSLSELQSCVPVTACPGVDALEVEEMYARLLLREDHAALHTLLDGFAVLVEEAIDGNSTDVVVNGTVRVQPPRTDVKHSLW
jgi:hypothetical protein